MDEEMNVRQKAKEILGNVGIDVLKDDIDTIKMLEEIIDKDNINPEIDLKTVNSIERYLNATENAWHMESIAGYPIYLKDDDPCMM